MKRKPNYKKSSELRADAESKMKVLEEKAHARINGSKQIKKEEKYESYDELLKDYMTPDLIEYCQGPAFRYLCIQLQSYLESKFSMDNLQALSLAKENFEDSIRFKKDLKNEQEHIKDEEICCEEGNHTDNN